MKPKNAKHTALLAIIKKKRRIPNWVDAGLKSVSSGASYETYEEAKDAGVEEGLYCIARYTEDEMHEALVHLGFEFRYNIVANDIEMRHPTLTKNNWVSVRKKSKEVAMLSRGLHNVCFNVASIKSIDPETKEAAISYFNAPIKPSIWGKNADGILGNLNSLVVEHGDGEIPSVHPLREFLEQVREHRKKLSPEKLNDAKKLASTFLNVMPHLRPTNKELGDACSLNIAVGLGYRLIESEKDMGYRPMAQREMVFLASPLEWKIGKTAAMVSIVPPSLTDRVLENFTLGNEREMHRAIKGKFFVIADDLSGFTSKQGEAWKSFQTQTRPSVDDKYKDIKEFPRTDWIVGTANDMFVPPNNALTARIVVCEVASTDHAKNVPAPTRGKDIARFFDKYRMSLFAGAVTLAEEGVDIEVPDSLWSARKEAIANVMAANDELRDLIMNYIDLECNHSTPYISMRSLLHEIGFLTYQSGPEKGEVIKSDCIDGSEIEYAYRRLISKSPPEYRAALSIIEGLGWRSKRVRTGDDKYIRAMAPINDKSYRPWAVE